MHDLQTVTLIITSYNQAQTLKLLFASLDRQTYSNFEVVIADDGSSDETPQVCRQKRKYPVQFVTQEDLGYRKAKILNRAIDASTSDYVIFLDGDLILEKHFVEDHIRIRKKGHFVCGRRVELGPEVSRQITIDEVACGKFDHLSWKLIQSSLKKDTTSLKRSLRISSPVLRKILGYDRPLDILGSNLSVWKSDLLEVNGFNESLATYWGEDGDLFIRLRNSGKIAIGAKSLCVQYHIFHKRREPNPETVAWYQSLLKNTEYKRAEKGLKQT